MMKKTSVPRIQGHKFLLILALSLTLAFSCSSPSRKGREKASPVLLVGIDGLEWNILLPLVKNNRLPNLAELMKNGTYGKLATIRPTVSPVIWTSIATGKGPKKHGIRRFVSFWHKGKPVLANSRDRKTKAIWDIVSDYRQRVDVIGWWMTFPVDKISGVMVAQTNAPAEAKPTGGKDVWKGTLLKGIKEQVYPSKRQGEMMAILDEVDRELPDITKQIFGRFPHPLSELSQRLWNNCQWAFRADETYRRIALKLAQRRPLPDLMCLYLGGTDVVSHRFWRYMQPDVYAHPPSAEEVANFGKIIENYYIYADRTVGELQKAYGPETTLIIVSDHGFVPIHLKGTYDSGASLASINSAHHYSALPGVFLAAGPLIQKSPLAKPLADLTGDELETVGSVLDIAPTLLAMMQIPMGEDMDGKLMKSIFPEDFWAKNQVKSVPTHDTRSFLAKRSKATLDDPAREERLEQLRSLGYIGQEGEKKR